MKKKSATMPPDSNRDSRKKHDAKKPVPPLPTVGAPLDGSQYLNIIEEQVYSEQRPSREEQRPRHADSANTA